MSTTTARHPRPLGLRAVLAASVIAMTAAAPVVAFAEATHPPKTTVSADPSDVDWYYVPDGGGGGAGG